MSGVGWRALGAILPIQYVARISTLGLSVNAPRTKNRCPRIRSSLELNGAVPPAPIDGPNGARPRQLENTIEEVIFNSRFFTASAVVGSMAGALLCFFKGSSFIYKSYIEYYNSCLRGFSTGKVVMSLLEALDVYLMGTVMLIFGMGLYELFIARGQRRKLCNSNFFGVFPLQEQPRWLKITSLEELKTKLGHVIVMALFVGMFDKSKKVPVNNTVDLLYLSASMLLASACLFLLSKLHSNSKE